MNIIDDINEIIRNEEPSALLDALEGREKNSESFWSGVLWACISIDLDEDRFELKEKAHESLDRLNNRME